ncbi:MAG TPA: polysaccharide biosynthesis/export family protein [Azospirillaceae bacterium]|nr:polysaccharide biosynthesis/export family protein [Azospirillaceae bacterium]
MALLVPATVAAGEYQYTLNPGDVLDISVWKEDGLHREVLVLPDGTISFPLAGQFTARGLTVAQVRENLRRQLQPYIPDAEVSVAVKSAVGNRVYVLGQVNRPGEFPVVGRVSIMQALTLAGGLTPYASENAIKVLRRQGDTETALPFRYGDVKRGTGLEQNIPLTPGDVVVVPSDGLF